MLVHEYQELDMKLMIEVIEKHLDDLVNFTNYLLQCFKGEIK